MVTRNNRVNPEMPQRGPARSFMQVIDNYVQPMRDTRSEQAMDRAFGQIGGLLDQKAQAYKKERNEQEYQEGYLDAIREEAGEELQGVKSGSIFRQDSTYYKAGLNEQRGKAAGVRFKNDSISAYENEFKKAATDDPEHFRAWMADRTNKFLSSNDNPEWLAGALPYVQETTHNLATQHRAFTDNRLQEEQFEAFQLVVDDIFAGVANGDYTTTGEVPGDEFIDWDAAIDDMIAEADELYEMEGGIANEKLVEAAIASAGTNMDMTPLVALGKAHDSGKLKLSVANQNRIKRAADALESDLASKASKLSTAQKAERDALIAQHGGNLQRALRENPDLDVYDWMVSQGLSGSDTELFSELVKVQETMDKANANSAPPASEQMMGFQIEYRSANTPKEKYDAVMKAARDGTISAADVTKYLDDIDQFAAGTSVFQNDIIKRRKGAFIEQVTIAGGNSYYDDGQKASIAVTAEQLMDEYLIQNSPGVDLSDPNAANKLLEDAKEHTRDMLWDLYPALKTNAESGEVAQQVSLGAAGFGENVEEDAQELAAEAQRQAAALTQALETERVNTMTGNEDLIMNQAVLPEDREVEINAMIENEPPAWELIGDDVEYDEGASTFYGQLLNAFTNGRDDNADYIATAATVMRDDPEFAEGVNKLARKYSVDPLMLLAVMDFETGGTFDPMIENAAGSGATGIIQFMPNTARALGTTVEELAGMSRAQQLVYVEKYLDQFSSKIRGGQVDDVYMAVLYPKAAGKPDNYPLFTEGTIAYRQNAGLDRNGDGIITKVEAAHKVKQKYLNY